jgi:hypothetical protein
MHAAAVTRMSLQGYVPAQCCSTELWISRSDQVTQYLAAAVLASAISGGLQLLCASAMLVDPCRLSV